VRLCAPRRRLRSGSRSGRNLAAADFVWRCVQPAKNATASHTGSTIDDETLIVCIRDLSRRAPEGVPGSLTPDAAAPVAGPNVSTLSKKAEGEGFEPSRSLSDP
jgi:hypothetical protein